MNPDIKQRWVEALRSGEYQKDTGRLRTNEGYCCLGVLTDLYSKEVDPIWETDNNIDYFAGSTGSERERYVLPKCVAQWAGLYTSPTVPTHYLSEDIKAVWSSNYIGITEVNDRDNGEAVTFNDIADLIEKAL